MILIGSRALAIRVPGLLRREPKDFDFVCTRDEYDTWKDKNLHKVNPTVLSCKTNSFGMKEIWSFVDNDAPDATPCEFEFVDPDRSNILFYNLVINDPDTIKTSLGLIPSLDLLYTLKSTHKHLKDNPHFWKSLFDYHAMRSAGAKIPENALEFFKAREKETYSKQKHPSLMRNKENFFKGDGITYVYDHDSIHKAIAIHTDTPGGVPRPAYTYFQRDDHEVACDKDKFFSIDEKYRIASVIEESAVLAIERSLVPHPGVLTPEQAWKMAFSKVLTSITSGWWRTWAYDNAMAVLSAWSADKTAYHRAFLRGLENGTVKPYADGIGDAARAMAG